MSSTPLTFVASRSESKTVPLWLGFFLAARVAITLLVFRTDPTAATAVTIGCSFVLLFFSWAVTPHSWRSRPLGAVWRWLLLYILMMAVSVLWSFAKVPLIALAYWSALVADCLSVYWISARHRQDDVLNRLLAGFVMGAAAVGLIAWYLPTLPDLRIGDEDFLHPNTVGYVLAIATLFAMYLARRVRWMAALALFCGVTLLRTLSKASIAAFAAAAVYYVLRSSHLKTRTRVAIGIAAAIVIACSWGFLEAYAVNYEEANQVETLTGRTYIWAVAWDEAWKTPWLGHGFYSFRFVIPVLGSFEPWQAHNELLQQFFCYGVVGFAVFAGLYWSFARSIRSATNHSLAVLAGAILVFALVRGLVDTERFDLNCPLWLITLFATSFNADTAGPELL